MRLCMKHWDHLKAKTPEGTTAESTRREGLTLPQKQRFALALSRIALYDHPSRHL